MFRRQRHIAGQRGVEIRFGHLDQLLKLTQFIVGKSDNFGVGKPAEDQIHLAGATMPAAKQ